MNLSFDDCTDTLMKGRRIEIRRFESFCVRESGAYTEKNHKAGKKIDVKPKSALFQGGVGIEGADGR